MKIAIINTGDEVMQGIILNTNAQWLSEKCHALGHEIVWHASVGDDLKTIGRVVRDATKLADCVFVTGGLGPTADDLTVEAVAKTFRKKLILDKKVLAVIEAYFQKRGRIMAETNRKQAFILQGGKPLSNEEGTAPGIQIRLGDAMVFLLPGVPKELYRIFDHSIAPWLKQKSKGECVEKILRCFGMAEAAIAEKIEALDFSNVRLSYRLRFPEVLLKVLSRDNDVRCGKRAVQNKVKEIRSLLGDIIYGEGQDLLPSVVVNLLQEAAMNLATAESCTGGTLAHLLTDVPGVSSCFDRTVVSYSNRAKIDMLDVDEQIIQRFGAVSKEVALEMARGVRLKSGTSIGMGITGIAGPAGGTKEKPVGTVFIAINHDEGEEVHQFLFARERIEFKILTAWTALDLLRRYLLRAHTI